MYFSYYNDKLRRFRKSQCGLFLKQRIVEGMMHSPTVGKLRDIYKVGEGQVSKIYKKVLSLPVSIFTLWNL